MPGAIRPNRKAADIAYALLKTPKDKRQNNKPPTIQRIREWFRDSTSGQ